MQLVLISTREYRFHQPMHLKIKKNISTFNILFIYFDFIHWDTNVTKSMGVLCELLESLETVNCDSQMIRTMSNGWFANGVKVAEKFSIASIQLSSGVNIFQSSPPKLAEIFPSLKILNLI